MTQQTIYLIGAGFTGWDGFPAMALEIIGKADIMIGHQRHLAAFPDFAGEKRVLGDLPELIEFLKNTDQRIVLLASGDPTFFGISRFLLRNLPKERIEIFPNVTSMQYAFARLKEPWDDGIFVSVHGRGMHQAVDKIIAAEKACVLTDTLNTPAAIAAELVADERGLRIRGQGRAAAGVGRVTEIAGVYRVVAEKFIALAMPGIDAGLGGDVDDGTGVAAVLRAEGRVVDLEFIHRVDGGLERDLVLDGVV